MVNHFPIFLEKETTNPQKSKPNFRGINLRNCYRIKLLISEPFH